MPVEKFTSSPELDGLLQARLIESVEAIDEEMEQGGQSPLFTDEHSMFAEVCSQYVIAVRLARAGWSVSDEMPLWWTEVVTDDLNHIQQASQWLLDRKLGDASVALFYEKVGVAAFRGRLVLMSEDQMLSAKFRMMFDH